jgi:hypothetical protein
VHSCKNFRLCGVAAAEDADRLRGPNNVLVEILIGYANASHRRQVKERFMRLTPRTPPLRLGLLVLLTVALSRSVDVLEQPPQSRYFQMALFTYEFMEGGVNWLQVSEYVDIPMFEGYSDASHQPAGGSIMRLPSWDKDEPLALVKVDWSRVLAVLIDEPFATAVYHYDDPLGSAACDAQREGIDDTKDKLVAAAAAVHDVAPRTRVWVNYSAKDVKLMRRDFCPLALNDTAIDVVSLGAYEADFFEIKDDYDWLISENPQQQIALVPGTHYRETGDRPSQAAARLQGYFAYANNLNEQCNIGLGRVGRTGNYDGCRVWVVTGWLAQPVYREASHAFYGLLSESASPIRDAWSSQLAKARRVGRQTLFSD